MKPGPDRDAALEQYRRRADVYDLELALFEPIRREADLVGTDGHAGSIETSEMLVVAESLVRLDRIPAVTRPRLTRFRILAHPEVEFPTGVRGDTSKVSRALGERSLGHTVDEIVRVLQSLDAKGAEW